MNCQNFRQFSELYEVSPRNENCKPKTKGGIPMKHNLKNSFSVCQTICLGTVLSISFTLPSLAEEFNPIRRNKRFFSEEIQPNAKAKRLGLMSVIAPNPVEPQIPEQFFEGNVPESFTNGVLTQLGVKRKKGRHGRTATEKEILARAEADKQNKYLVPFAVIDTGVDLSVPEVRSLMQFDIVDGEIVGSGFDFLSGKPWGIPYIQDPWMYVLGADEVTPGTLLIKGALENPITYLSDLNERVMSLITEAIRNNPSLKTSYFSKMNSKNTNMIGLLRLLQYQINPEMIEALSSEGKLLSPDMEPKNLNPSELALHGFSKSKWLLSPSSGLPDYFSSFDLEYLKGLPELQQEIAKLLNGQTEIGKEVFKNLGNLNLYLRGHHFTAKSPLAQIRAYSLEMVSNQIAAKKLGTQIYHPMFELLLTLRQMKAEKPQMTYEALIDHAVSTYSQTMKWMQKDSVTAFEPALMMELQSNIDSLDQVKRFILGAENAKSIDDILLEFEKNGSQLLGKTENTINRKFAIRARYPGLHPTTMGDYHGTHVATTARTYLDEDFYRIVSYRIGLGLVAGNRPVENVWAKKNIDAMYEWFKKPVVAQAIYNLFTEDSKMNFPFDVNTEEGRLKLADFMRERFVSYHTRDASASGIVGQALHWNLVEAVKDISKRKIPVANLSIGGHFEQPEHYPTIDTTAERIGSSLDFIFGEFQKYTVAEAISTYGKNTMFFMAAGNANNFGDAEKLSNYPADLRSPWLKRAKGDNVEKLPGEKLGNLIGVMSLNPKKRTSNFSNLILTDNEIYLIRGENIRANSMSYSMETSETAIRARTPEIYMTQNHIWNLRPDDPRVQLAMKEMNMTMEEFNTYRVLIHQAIESNVHSLKIQYNDQRAEISGTSMASPSAAALALVEYYKRLKAADKSNAEAYGKKGFRPSEINAALKKMATKMILGTKRLQLPTLQEFQKNAPPTEEELALKRELNRRRGETESATQQFPVSKNALTKSCTSFYAP